MIYSAQQLIFLHRPTVYSWLYLPCRSSSAIQLQLYVRYEYVYGYYTYQVYFNLSAVCGLKKPSSSLFPSFLSLSIPWPSIRMFVPAYMCLDVQAAGSSPRILEVILFFAQISCMEVFVFLIYLQYGTHYTYIAFAYSQRGPVLVIQYVYSYLLDHVKVFI